MASFRPMVQAAEQALVGSGTSAHPIAPCDHYAGNEKFIRKAVTLQQESSFVFDVTCDLEDGAPVGQEGSHARLLIALIDELASDSASHIGLRVHDPEHPHFKADLELSLSQVGKKLSHITIPKIQDLSAATDAISLIEKLSEQAGLSTPPPLHLLIETHGALAEVHQIAKLPHLRCLDFGLMDFISEHAGAIPAAAMQSPGQFDHPLVRRAKLEIAAAALGNGLTASHCVTTDIVDLERVRSDARRARDEFGYLRMWSIHPSQIAVICETLRPSFDEVQFASRLLREAHAAQWGPIRFEDTLHDRASYRYYWELLKRAQVAGVAVDEEAWRLLAD